jgi:hypothetical protein
MVTINRTNSGPSLVTLATDLELDSEHEVQRGPPSKLQSLEQYKLCSFSQTQQHSLKVDLFMVVGLSSP